MLEYTRGQTHTLYTNFLTIDNKEAVSIVDPKVTIRHVDSGNILIVDVNEADLTLATETLYFYKWVIPIGADTGFYTIEYEGIVDGEYAESNETVKVVSSGEAGASLIGVLYTTKAKVAEYLGVNESDINDDWIEWASRYIDLYTCQKFSPIIVTEKYDIDRLKESTLMLDNYPIINITEVKNDGIVMNLNDIAIYNDEGFLKIKDSFITSSSSILEVGFFARGIQTIEVTYEYGHATVPKIVEWIATILTATIAIPSLAQSGILTVGDVVEEEIGEYRRKRSVEESGASNFSSNIEGSKNVNDRLEEDVFSAKNALRQLKCRDMRSV